MPPKLPCSQADWDTFKAIRNEVINRECGWLSITGACVANSLSHQPKFTWKQLNSAFGWNKRGAINVRFS